MLPYEKIIVALDVDTIDKAKRLVEELQPYVGCFKIGSELTTGVGTPRAVAAVRQLGGEVFLDNKFYDIPRTVGAAALAACQQGIKMFTVAAASSIESMQAAVAAIRPSQTLVLAATVPTSMGEDEARTLYGLLPHQAVAKLASYALLAGVQGIVCSAQDLRWLEQNPELDNLFRVTPGIRPVGSPARDQKRYATPTEAIRWGAHYLVIGDPIIRPAQGSPAQAACRIADEIAEAMN